MSKKSLFAISVITGMIGASIGTGINNTIDKNKDDAKAERHELTKNDSIIVQMANDPNVKSVDVFQEICAQEGCSYTDRKKHIKEHTAIINKKNRVRINDALEAHGRKRIVYSKDQKEYFERQNELKAK